MKLQYGDNTSKPHFIDVEASKIWVARIILDNGDQYTLYQEDDFLKLYGDHQLNVRPQSGNLILISKYEGL